MQVETVKGPIETTALGATLMHEHVFVLNSEILTNYGTYWEEEARIADAVTKLRELKGRGIDSIVDPTVIGLGRYLPRIQRVAEQVDINIVVATGLYTYNDLPFYFHYRGPGTLLDGPEPLVEMFIGDITEGIAGTGVKAGILKCATDAPGLTPGVERVLRAVAQAHRATGVPITTHTDVHTKRGLDQQRVFEEEGVDLSRVIIGHSGDSTDLAYLEDLLSKGSYLGMDRFGIDAYCSFDDRVNTVVTLCERGYADRMVLSHDASCFIDWFPHELLTTATPNWHYLHISDDVVPELRKRGVPDEQIDQLLIGNPRAIFERQGAY
jgi:phosphotriesterase-related protein